MTKSTGVGRGGARPNAGGLRSGAGRKPGVIRKASISVRIHPDLLAALRLHRDKTGQSVNATIIKAIERYLNV